MKLRKQTPVLMMAILIGFVQIYTGCTQDPVGLDDLASTEAPSNVDNVSGFYVRTKFNALYSYTTHKGTGIATDDWTEPCSVQSTDAVKDITCIIEAKELDLYFNGFELEYNVPQNMCEYFTYLPPYYYNFEPGIGGLSVQVNNDDVAHGTLAPQEIEIDGVTAANIYCPYDYSNQANPAAPTGGGGPNCCIGTYNKTVYNSDGGSTITTESWGGSVANCLQGPAMEISPISSTGFPMTTIIKTADEGTNDSYVVRSPLSFTFWGNFYASNYFVAADHPVTAGIPRAYAAVAGVGPATNPYHEFVCYDRAEEIQARIRVMVREWNLSSEFDFGASGDPDTATNEPGFGNPPNNDIWDLKDLGDAYPEEL